MIQCPPTSVESILGYAKDSNAHSETAIDCALGHSDFGLPIGVSKYLSQGISPLDIVPYPAQIHKDELIRELRAYYSSLHLNQDNCFFGFGINHLFERIFSKIFARHRLLAVGPYFVQTAKHVVANGGKLLSIHRDLSSSEYPIAEACHLIRQHKNVPSVFYIDNPNNPLGSVVSLDEIRSIAKVCDQSNIPMIVDEAYADFLPEEYSAISLIPEFSRLIVARSFSKFFGMSGLRIGLICTGKSFEIPVAKFSQPYEPSTIALKAAALSLKDDAYIRRVRKTVASHKGFLLSKLVELEIEALPTHPLTNILSLSVPRFQLYQALLDVEVETIPGSSFGVTHRLLSDAIVRMRIPETQSKLSNLISRLKNLNRSGVSQ